MIVKAVVIALMVLSSTPFAVCVNNDEQHCASNWVCIVMFEFPGALGVLSIMVAEIGLSMLVPDPLSLHQYLAEKRMSKPCLSSLQNLHVLHIGH